MKSFKKVVEFARALKSNRGVTAIEYGLILSLIALAIVAAVNVTSASLSGTFNTIAGLLANASH